MRRTSSKVTTARMFRLSARALQRSECFLIFLAFNDVFVYVLDASLTLPTPPPNLARTIPPSCRLYSILIPYCHYLYARLCLYALVC